MGSSTNKKTTCEKWLLLRGTRFKRKNKDFRVSNYGPSFIENPSNSKEFTMTAVNKTENANPEGSIVETTIDPWQELKTGFKGIRLLKNPIRLKEIRDSAQQLKADYIEQIARLNGQLPDISDELDKLSAQHSIKGLEDRISAIEKNLAGINTRVEELVEES